MSSNEKNLIKVYKNPQRTQVETPKAYTPQYQTLGVEPLEHKTSSASAIAIPSTDNPRVRPPVVRQAYAQNTDSPLGRGKSPMLNVGNNVEHTWSSVDGQIIDDLTDIPIDPNHPMVDNNDFVSTSALGLPREELPVLDEVATPSRTRFTRDQVSESFQRGYSSVVNVTTTPAPSHDLLSVVQDLEEDTYLVIIEGVPVCSGPLEEIQEQARALVFGEHELCDGNPVSIDDIIILKRAKVKIGLFLE